MSSPALDDFLATVDANAAPTVVALDEAIRQAYPGFDVAVKYRILMYALGADWRHWVCAVSVSTSSVGLRFLYGVLLGDPRGVLRPGSSTLMTWDFAKGEAVDAAGVGAYVSEAVATHVDYLAHADQVLAASRAKAEAEGRRPKPRAGG